MGVSALQRAEMFAERVCGESLVSRCPKDEEWISEGQGHKAAPLQVKRNSLVSSCSPK